MNMMKLTQWFVLACGLLLGCGGASTNAETTPTTPTEQNDDETTQSSVDDSSSTSSVSDLVVPDAQACTETSSCEDGQQCTEGACLPGSCTATYECPYGYRCQEGQCQLAECFPPNPSGQGGADRPCPEGSSCEFQDAISARNGDGYCSSEN
jgi:hypothetical protein